MTREEMIEAYNGITDVDKDVNVIYAILDGLGVKYKRTRCRRCRNDLKNIAAEELGLIHSAADLSQFDTVTGETYTWAYVRDKAVWCDGRRYNQYTDPALVEEFVKKFPTGYYEKRVEKPQTAGDEEIINNQE